MLTIVRVRTAFFTVPVEYRYHMEIVSGEGDIIGREIEYNDELDWPAIRFLD